jgi:hypothetical protein
MSDLELELLKRLQRRILELRDYVGHDHDEVSGRCVCDEFNSLIDDAQVIIDNSKGTKK